MYLPGVFVRQFSRDMRRILDIPLSCWPDDLDELADFRIRQ